MEKPLTEEILNRCPNIFRGQPEILCANGWYEIILDLSVAIEAITQKLKSEGVGLDDLPKVVQVKEKFGTLRYYIHNTSDDIERLRDLAQTKSASTCERCGMKGTLRYGSYVLTLCNDCNSKIRRS